MKYAIVTISGSRATAKIHAPIVAGTVGGTVSFQFDESWDGMTKTLVWRGSGVTVDDTACTGIIPAEVVAAPGRLFVGVYGTKDNTATPTTWADLGQVMPGADPSGDESTDPSLPVWAQIMERTHIDDTAIATDSTWSSKKIINNSCPDFTYSANPVSFAAVEGTPLTVVTEHMALQYGTGTPGLDNVRPIFPCYDDFLYLYYNGKQLFNGVYDSGFFELLADGSIREGSEEDCDYIAITGYIPVTSGQAYTLSGGILCGKYYDSNQNPLTTEKDFGDGCFIPPSGVSYIRFSFYESEEIQLEYGYVATDYEPYFQDNLREVHIPTVYDGSIPGWYLGTMDWQTGIFTADKILFSFIAVVDGYIDASYTVVNDTSIQLDLEFPILKNGGGYKPVGICSHSPMTTAWLKLSSDRKKIIFQNVVDNWGCSECSVEAWAAMMEEWCGNGTSLQMCLHLATPEKLQLSVPEPIVATGGTQTMSVDCGIVTVSGKAELKSYLENLYNAIIALGGMV